MRWDSIRLHALGPFRDVEIDFASLPGVLTAITGRNGAGKSTLLELMAASLYRTCPTRGSLRDLATERGAWCETRIVNGSPWTVRQVVDPVSGKSEALILDAAGTPVIDTAKVRDADAWVRAHLSPPEVLYASTFGVQGSEGFLSMKPGDRKAVLLRVLGVERLETLAAEARERAREARQALAIVEARIADERRRGGDVEALAADVERRHEAIVEATARLEASRAQLAEQAESDRVEARRRDLRERLSPLDSRAARLVQTLSRASEIRGAAAQRASLLVELEAVESEARDAESAARDARATLAKLRAEYDAERTSIRYADEMIASAEALLASSGDVRVAAMDLDRVHEGLASADASVVSHRERLDGLLSERVSGADQRIELLRGALIDIVRWTKDEPVPVAGIATTAQLTLDADDAEVTRASTLPGEIHEARRLLRFSETQRDERRAVVARTERLAARLPEIERASADLDRLTAERDAAKLRASEIRAQAEPLAAEAKAHEAVRDASIIRRHRLSEAAHAIADDAAQADGLAVAEAQLAEVEAQASTLRAEIEALPRPWAKAGLDFTERARNDERTLRDAERALASAEAGLEQATQAAARIVELESERGAIEADLADWNALAAGLGRDGVQAALIDAAGPELTEMVNDLLHSALGSRFTMTIETTRLDSTGKRQLEGLDVRVIDTEAGRDALVETYSVGERVLLGEAVSLALTMLACRRSGAVGPTIVRDESGAALDAERARQWVAMVRRAADLIGASRVLIVTHSAEVAELCDSRLLVADGGVSVEA